MNEHTLKVLEFDQLINLIQKYAVSDPGRQRLAAFKPSGDKSRAHRLTPLYKSFLNIRNSQEELPEADFYTPDPVLVKLKPEGAVIDSLEVHVIARLMKITDKVRKFTGRDSFKNDEALLRLTAGMADFREVLEHLSKIFDDKGDIKDNASPVLNELRPKIHDLEKKITHKLNKIVKSDPDGIFQGAIVTRRNNRFVIPLKRENKSKIKAIVHDESASGRTLFVEPQSIVNDGNELVSTIKDTENEIRRILTEVSNILRNRIADIEKSFRALCIYDAAFAVSAWALDFDCIFAENAGNYELIKARHPLLQQNMRKEDNGSLVPLNLKLNKAKVLAITGSNTGGKTVALKTIGLFSLMYQAGLPIPADKGSRLPFFENILADIGDEQSLEQSLSTFSGHLKNIAEVLDKTNSGRSLVLLDELGSGTDPVEGGALGCAIINTLSQRDTMTFVTTHLSMIKVFVHESKSMVNASVRFNQKTLKPEYVLDVGLPGASHALSIAAKLQIPEDVITKAKSFLSEDTLQLENVLEKLDLSQRSLAKDAEKAKNAREEAVQQRDELKKELKELKRKRRESLHEAQKEAESIVENARKDMERIIKSLKEKGEIPEDVGEIRKKVEKKRDNLRDGIKSTASRPQKPLKKDVQKGDRVWIERMQDHGTVVSISADGKKAKVEVMGMPVEIKVSDLGAATAEEAVQEKKEVKVRTTFAKPSVSMELNLIGKRVETALSELETYLDNAVSAGKEEVRIIHGRGTGVLRQAIHEYLKNCSYVSHYSCPEAGEKSAGDTVTDVRL